jgi:acetyl esterase
MIMSLDPGMQAVLDAMAGAGLQISGEPLPQLIARMRGAPPAAPPALDDGVSTEDFEIPGPGGAIPARLYRPAATTPALMALNIHGGGWVMGSIAQDEPKCRQVAAGAGALVVSIDYRLAPEHPFPAPLDDCMAAWEWMLANSAGFGVAPERCAMIGTSAGANLAAACCLMARDRGVALPAAQVLVYPACDAACDSASYRDNGEGYFLTTESMRWFWDLYAPNASDRATPYASPLRAERFDGLPPALVITAEFDPLRDEGEAFGLRLREAGVPVEVTRYPGLVHGFLTFALHLPQSQGAITQICRFLAG